MPFVQKATDALNDTLLASQQTTPRVVVSSGARPSGPDAGVLFRSFLWVGVTAASLYFLDKIQETLLVFGLAWLIAYMLNPLVERMQYRRLGPVKRCPRALAVVAIYFVAISLGILVGSLVFPIVMNQVNHLLELRQSAWDPQKLSAMAQDRTDKLSAYIPERYRPQLVARVKSSLDAFSAEAGHSVGVMLSRVADFFVQLLKGALLFFSAALISIFVLQEWESLAEGFADLFPERYRNDARTLLSHSDRILGGYLRATVVTSLICSAATFAVLELFGRISGNGAPYAAVIALVTCVLYPIPLFGILMSTMVAAVLGFLPDMSLAVGLWTGGLCLVVNGIIDRTLQPKLMGDAIGVSPLFVIFAAAAGGEFIGGIVGMLMGIPCAAVVKVVFGWFRLRFLVDPSSRDAAPLPPLESVTVIGGRQARPRPAPRKRRLGRRIRP